LAFSKKIPLHLLLAETSAFARNRTARPIIAIMPLKFEIHVPVRRQSGSEAHLFEFDQVCWIVLRRGDRDSGK